MVAELWSRDFAFRSGGSATLSVIGRLPKRDGDGTIMRFGFPWGWSMLLTFGNFVLARWLLRPSMAFQILNACACRVALSELGNSDCVLLLIENDGSDP